MKSKSVSYQIGVDCVGQPVVVKHFIDQSTNTNSNGGSKGDLLFPNKQNYKRWNRKV